MRPADLQGATTGAVVAGVGAAGVAVGAVSSGAIKRTSPEGCGTGEGYWSDMGGDLRECLSEKRDETMRAISA